MQVFFGTLMRYAPEKMTLPWAERLNEDTLELFIDDLQDSNSATSIKIIVNNVRYVIKRLVPGAQLRYVQRRLREVPDDRSARTPVRTRSGPMMAAAIAAMRKLMEPTRAQDVDEQAIIGPWSPAELFRNALLLAMLAVIPLRLGNLVRTAIGVHVRATPNGGYVLEFAAAEMKGDQAAAFVLPAVLCEFFRFYLNEVRARIAGRAPGDELWVTRQGAGFSSVGLYSVVVRTSVELVGERLTPHLCRNVVADSCVDAGVSMHDTQHLLQHRRNSNTTEVYISSLSERGLVRQRSIVGDRLGQIAKKSPA